MDVLQRDYPWTKAPLVASAPMRLVALAPLAYEVSRAGGLGFLGAGNDVTQLENMIQEFIGLQKNNTLTTASGTLPFGVGFLLWAGQDLLDASLPILQKHRPAAAWLYAHHHIDDAAQWAKEIRRVTGGATKIWVQVGTVAEALEATAHCQPDVLVIQGQDAGGHGLLNGAGLIPLFPEATDAVFDLCTKENIRRPMLVAAGGIIEGRGFAAAIMLGASGVVLGTRYLAAPEANIAKGYRDAVLEAADGGVNTDRGKLYDRLRGTTDWPLRYGGRGVLNDSWYDNAKGMGFDENKKLYDEALSKGDEGWGSQARLTTYAGSGVGLTRKIQPAAEITEEIRDEARRILGQASGRFQ